MIVMLGQLLKQLKPRSLSSGTKLALMVITLETIFQFNRSLPVLKLTETMAALKVHRDGLMNIWQTIQLYKKLITLGAPDWVLLAPALWDKFKMRLFLSPKPTTMVLILS